MFTAVRKLRICVPHPVHHHARELKEERLIDADELSVTARPPDDPPEHIPPALVRGEHAVRDEKRNGPEVVGDHLVGDVGLVVLVVRHTGALRNLLDERLEQVALKVALYPLGHRGKPLETHARIDARLGKRRKLSGLVTVVLHEHEVPYLEVPVTVASHGTGGFPARHLRSLVDQDLGAWAAGTGIAHLPEVVLLSQANDPVGWDLCHVPPEVEGLVVILIDRDPELFLGKFDDDGEKLPGIRDRLFFEVIAEREIAEHLEERMVPRRVTHVLEIVVLAARPHALLARHGALVVPLLIAEKDAFELHHARVREQERRVVPRNEGRARHHLVPPLGEVIQKKFSQFV